MSVIHARLGPEAARVFQLATDYQARGHRPTLVVAVGLPGSGKSTFCRNLARRTHAALLESDWLRSQLFESPTHDTAESKRLFSAIYAAARELLAARVPVILDATNLRECDRRDAYEAANHADASILVLHFVAPEDVVLQRLERRSRHVDPADRSAATIEVYKRMASTQEPIATDHWTVDTSDPAATRRALAEASRYLSTPIQPSTGGTLS